MHAPASRLVVLAVALAGCAPGRSAVALTIDASGPLPDVSVLQVVATIGGAKSRPAVLVKPGGFTIPPSVLVALYFDRSQSGAATLEVTAFGGGGPPLATGTSAPFTISPSGSAQASVTLQVVSASPDLSMNRPADLASADLASADLAGAPDLALAAGVQFVVDRLTMPMQRSDYSIDLNGDGHPDNQYGNLVATLAAQNFDVQAGVDASIQIGDVIHLIEWQSPRSALFSLGKAMANPDYSGSGVFTKDPGADASLTGSLAGSVFTSEDPVTSKTPVQLTLRLPLLGALPPIAINGARISFSLGGGAPARLMKGQINGSIKNSDVEGILLPAVAMATNAQVQMDPNALNSKHLLALFDNGMCTNPGGVVAAANDGKIDLCEVTTNVLIKSVLSPDVQIFDGQGHYAPNPANSVKDSFSLGVAFTAVAAKF